MADNGLERLRQRVHERIIGDFNEFIDDEAIRELINEAVEKAFFERRVEVNDYGRRSETEPVIIEMVRAQAMTVVERQLKAWMVDNEDKVVEVIKSTFEVRFAELLAQSLNRLFDSQLMQFQQSIIDRLHSLGR